MPIIKPIAELRNTSKISETCHENNEPVFITKNGYGDLVVMSIETYERRMAQLDLYDKLAAAEKDVDYGRMSDSDEVLSKLKKKYGK